MIPLRLQNASTSSFVMGAGSAEYGTLEWWRKMRGLPSSHRLYPKVYSTVEMSPVVAQVKSYEPMATAVSPLRAMLWLVKTTFFQPLPPLIAKPASSPLNFSEPSKLSAPTKYDMASSPVGRNGFLVALVGLNKTSVWP